MDNKFEVRYAIIGIALLIVGGPMFFLSTSWIQYVGVILVVIGAGTFWVAFTRGTFP